MNIQRLTRERYDESMALWRYCFQDPETFTSFYYENRVNDVFYVGSRQIDAQMTVAAYEANVRGLAKRTAMLAGISTRPEMRGKGLMGAFMREGLRALKENGYAYASLYPFDYRFYEKYGFHVVNDHMLVSTSIARLPARPFEGEFEFVSRPGGRTGEFLSAYHKAFGMYSCIALRDGVAFETRLREVMLEDGYACLYRRGGEPEGYVLYQMEGKTIVAHEFCAATDAARRDGLAFLRGHSSTADAVKWVCPVDDPTYKLLSDPRGAAIVEPFAMGRIVDLEAALAGLPAVSGDEVVEVSDPDAPWNDGTWRFFESGGCLAVEKCDANPNRSISIGALAQAAFGYASEDSMLPSIKTFQFEAY